MNGSESILEKVVRAMRQIGQGFPRLNVNNETTLPDTSEEMKIVGQEELPHKCEIQ